MGKKELLRFEVDSDAAGLWEQVKGDLHRRRTSRVSNGEGLRVVSQIYLDIARRDRAELGRILDRIKLEDQGFDAR
jgi:hypothetical protein